MKQTLLHQVKTLVETERKLMRDEIRRREREIEHLRQQLLSSDTTNPSPPSRARTYTPAGILRLNFCSSTKAKHPSTKIATPHPIYIEFITLNVLNEILYRKP